MLKDLNKVRMSLKSNKIYGGMTPLWDEYYVKAQNKKFKNKWEKVKRNSK
ncbi:MAG TPA: hypothetical protein VJ911_10240 [Cryomorphaceae bacterium]|nr:hypothetical protein [Cryomorphaceae bacterium]